MSTPSINLEIDSIDCIAWDRLLTQFDDSNIHQTWAWANASRRNSQVSHFLLKQGPEVIACCQTQVRRVPIFNLRVADVRWGPLCCLVGKTSSSDLLPYIMHAIKVEYGVKRNCFLRIYPHVVGERKGQMKHFLEAEGFQVDRSERPYRTLMLDLTPSLEELRKNLLQRWRRHLTKAEKSDLVVVEGTGDELFQVFLTLDAEMRQRKQLGALDVEEYRRIQKDLPAEFKMKIMVCLALGNPVAATILSAIGNTGIYMLGATGKAGLELDASYLLHWRMIQWLKSNGMRYYDLGAINPQLNPGGFFFKEGIAGKCGWDETFLHSYFGCFNARARLTKVFIKIVNLLRHAR